MSHFNRGGAMWVGEGAGGDHLPMNLQKAFFSAVYTCIKKTESFVHLGFSREVARQLPLNTAKKPESKNPPPE